MPSCITRPHPLARLLLLIALVLGMPPALLGCRSLPDVQPFADSTSAMQHSIKTAGRTAVLQVSAIESSGDEAPAPGSPPSTPLAKDVFKHWHTRDNVFEALTAYSDSLCAIVQAGKDGQASALKLAESVKSLASTVSSSFPAGGPAVSLVTDSAAIAYAVIAKQRAATRLHQAIEYANPTIRAVAALVSADLADLRRLNARAQSKALAVLDMSYHDLPRLNELTDERLNLDIGEPADLAKLREIGELVVFETQSPWYAEYTTRRAAIIAQHRANDAMLEQTTVALDAWAKAHEAIGRAVETRSAPSLHELQRVTSDLLTVYHTYRLQTAKGM
ncbi:MAG: hypothetical protein KF864_04295 [Phycisphaeraceae bacterium]|nr:hypothetical protein [Phycisphaeraceae bacterium]